MNADTVTLFRHRIQESQPWFRHVQALADIDRLAAVPDDALPTAVAADVEAMSDPSFTAFWDTLVLLSAAAAQRAGIAPGPDAAARAERADRAISDGTASAAQRAAFADLTAVGRIREQLHRLGRTPVRPDVPLRERAVADQRRELFAPYSAAVQRAR